MGYNLLKSEMPRMKQYGTFIAQVGDHGLEFSSDALLVTQFSSDPGQGGVLSFRISSAGQCQPCLELKGWGEEHKNPRANMLRISVSQLWG